MGVILLNDATTGMPIGILDGTWITHMRTGASGAIGARYFARADSRMITIVGGGAEGRSGLEAISKSFQFDQVRIVDINETVLNDFVQEMTEKLAVRVVPFESVEEAARESDIILLTTTATEPLMRSEWSKPGDYVSTVSCFCDLDSKFIDISDKFLVDDKECALNRIRTLAGIEIPTDKVYGDICEVAAGKKPKRENDKEIITYTPAGMGAVDVGVAFEALELAKKKGVGKDVTLAQAFDPS
jgi:ornithine cyclodeaminase/alanine dehydrogenase-like protein (mu-crystallin family)